MTLVAINKTNEPQPVTIQINHPTSFGRASIYELTSVSAIPVSFWQPDCQWEYNRPHLATDERINDGTLSLTYLHSINSACCWHTEQSQTSPSFDCSIWLVRPSDHL